VRSCRFSHGGLLTVDPWNRLTTYGSRRPIRACGSKAKKKAEKAVRKAQQLAAELAALESGEGTLAA
jgi:hypothetical protein